MAKAAPRQIVFLLQSLSDWRTPDVFSVLMAYTRVRVASERNYHVKNVTLEAP